MNENVFFQHESLHESVSCEIWKLNVWIWMIANSDFFPRMQSGAARVRPRAVHGHKERLNVVQIIFFCEISGTIQTIGIDFNYISSHIYHAPFLEQASSPNINGRSAESCRIICSDWITTQIIVFLFRPGRDKIFECYLCVVWNREL